MIVKENKKPVAMTLAGSAILALASGYCYHAGFGGAALFASVVAAFCAFFCALRLGAKNYLQIGEDAFTIVRGANSESFEYKDIANLGTKTFVAGRNKTELLNFVFKKAPQAQDRFNFLRFYSDTEATLPGSFEISIYELSKILREKAGLLQSSEEEQAAPKTRKGAKKSASSAKNFKAKNFRDENFASKNFDAQSSCGAQNLDENSGAENSRSTQDSAVQNSNGAADSNGAQNLKGASNLNEQSSAAPNGAASSNDAAAGENFTGTENSAPKFSAGDNGSATASESAAAASYDAADAEMQSSACESKNK
ncbi:hypothetical protein [uncultured Campylobacter sp.]|uniref:hypothetical protein n=1 Tax=uncultured Campylobacter sp. TaxID=218934 RepID=UPI002628E83D|nr:hypothetical protein [uncultured Campylobacter sp.]